jgi:hypothetical protein
VALHLGIGEQAIGQHDGSVTENDVAHEGNLSGLVFCNIEDCKEVIFKQDISGQVRGKGLISEQFVGEIRPVRLPARLPAPRLALELCRIRASYELAILFGSLRCPKSGVFRDTRFIENACRL